MFIVNFKDADIGQVNRIVTELNDADMTAYTHVMYEKTRGFSEDLTNYQVNNFLLDLTAVNQDNFDVDDFILNIIESGHCPVIKLPEDEEMLIQFNECVKLYQLKYLEYELVSLQREPELDSMLDYCIIDEIFNSIMNLSVLYSPMNYVTVVNVHRDNLDIDGMEYSFVDFRWETLFDHIDTDTIKEINSADYFLSKYLVTPVPFTVIPKEDMVQRLNEYKSKVFYKATQLNAREISKLPQEVANIFTSAGYVPRDTVDKYREQIESLG